MKDLLKVIYFLELTYDRSYSELCCQKDYLDFRIDSAVGKLIEKLYQNGDFLAVGYYKYIQIALNGFLSRYGAQNELGCKNNFF